MLSRDPLAIFTGVLLFITTMPDVDILLRAPRIYQNDTFFIQKPVQCIEKRVIVEQVITKEQCQRLKEITDTLVQTNSYDSYDLAGVPWYDAWRKKEQLSNWMGDMDFWRFVRERVRSEVEHRLSPYTPLYNEFTHLTKRSADSSNLVEGYSHFLHSDNCDLAHTGDQGFYCTPGFSHCCFQRSHTAILYLGDEGEDFDGGEFVFANALNIPPELPVDQGGCPVDENPGVRQTYTVKPKCGMLVAFTSGPENVHGVLEVKRGSRYALAQWFTQDPYYAENYYG